MEEDEPLRCVECGDFLVPGQAGCPRCSPALAPGDTATSSAASDLRNARRLMVLGVLVLPWLLQPIAFFLAHRGLRLAAALGAAQDPVGILQLRRVRLWFAILTVVSWLVTFAVIQAGWLPVL